MTHRQLTNRSEHKRTNTGEDKTLPDMRTKANPLEAWNGPEVSMILRRRLPYFRTVDTRRW